MAQDFLNNVTKQAEGIINHTSNSPYQIKKEGSKTAQIRNSTYKEVKLIAFQEDRKMIDVLDELIHIGLNDPKFKKYNK